jgi:glucosamine-6-phosphate deaminase
MGVALSVIPDDRWAASVAGHFTAAIGPGARLCLATGATTAPLYTEIAGMSDLAGITIFLLDEFGGLPAGDAGRCAAMLRRDLLDRAHGKPVVHAPDVDAADPAGAAARYADRIADGGIDLAIVGLGRNGHVGMNEPGSNTAERTRVVTLDPSTSEGAIAYGASTHPTWGITVGIAELLEARTLWLVVTGVHKREILHRFLSEDAGPHLPATLVRNHPGLAVYVDESAYGSK